MRTLKKTLCLVLCLAMMAGLCAVCASAEFTDADEIEYKEAVDVLTGIGVIDGFEAKDGTFAFQPDGTLTRAQACKIMACMLGIDEYAGECTFADSKDHWAAKYIAACAAEGIVNGYDENTFAPEDKLTGVAWAKMLLCAAGYDADYEGLKGADWQYYTIKLAKSKLNVEDKTNLCNGLPTGFDLTKPISRDEACQMAFTALFINFVVYDDNTVNVKAGDVEVTAGKVSSHTIDDTIAEENYETLKAGVTADDFGNPIDVWTYNPTGKKVLTVFAENQAPAYTFTATKDIEASEDADELSDMLNDKLKLTGKKALVFADADYFYVNGDRAKKTAGDAVVTDYEGTAIEAGSVVKVYATKTNVDIVVVEDYDLAQLTVKDLTSAQLKNIAKKVASGAIEANSDEALATQKVSADSDYAAFDECYDTEFADFDYADDDFVLVAVNAAGAVIGSKQAEIVEGKVTAKKGTGATATYTIDGVAYRCVDALAIGKEYTYALDETGVLAALIEGETAESTYAYLYNVVAGTGEKNDDGFAPTTYTAYVVLADGTKASYPTALVEGCVMKDATHGSAVAFYDFEECIVDYAINAKGQFVVNAVESTTDLTVGKNGTTYERKVVVGGETYYTTAETLFVFAKMNTAGTVMEVTTQTGYANVQITAKPCYVVTNVKGEATTVFVLNEDTGVDTTGTVAVLLDAAPVETYNAPGKANFFTYKVAVDGEEVDDGLVSVGAIIGTDGEAAELAAGDVFSYKTTGTGTVVASRQLAFEDMNNEVLYAGDYIYYKDSANKDVEISLEKAKVFTITATETATGYEYTVEEGGTFVAENEEDEVDGSMVGTFKVGTVDYIYIAVIIPLAD